MDNIKTAIGRIRELQDAPGQNTKMEIIRRYQDDEDFKKLLRYALDPRFTYNVSAKTLRTHKGLPDAPFIDITIYDVCEALSRKSALTNDDLNAIHQFLLIHSIEESEFYIELLSKTLRLGVTAKTVNRVIPNLIFDWNIQQAYRIDDYPVKSGKEFWLTQKLNGVRATYYRGNLYARSGVPYEGLGHILRPLNDLVKFLGVETVFDGELTLLSRGNLSDNEAFRTSTGIINSDAKDKTMIGYTIFDTLSATDFDEGGGKAKYLARRGTLDLIHAKIERDMPDCPVSVLPVLYHGTNVTMIDKFLDQMVREDKEGLMLNYNVPYKCKRHSGILKIKRFYTVDLEILGAEEGEGRLAGTLGALVVDYKGNEVRVGSGFTDEDRASLWNDRVNLPRKICEVKYKEISSDKKTGAESLQFPVFVGMRNDKIEPSLN